MLLSDLAGQAGESPHPHPHAEVLTLREAGREVVRIGIASDADPPRPEALSGTVTGLRLALARVPLAQLDQTSRSPTLSPVGALHSLEVDLVTVRRELDARGEPVPKSRMDAGATKPSRRPTAHVGTSLLGHGSGRE